MKSDLVLPNGARFYNDHTHPEYATPECRTLKDLLAYDRAGELIVRAAARRRNQELGGEQVQLYKNNTDFHGHSYGCHDNYLVPRSVAFTDLAEGLMAFLVTRQVVAGSGKVGIESQERGFQPGPFQLSQRADFMETELGVDTMHNRPILNTRDEPHANPRRYRRLHLIVGDANLCEQATALKVGTTQLVLELIARGLAPRLIVSEPVLAIRAVSRDPDLKTFIQLRDGRSLSAVQIQETYLEAARQHLAGQDPDTDWILQQWADTLQTLVQNRSRLIGKLDWVTKLWLLETFMQEQRIGWDDPWLASLDLEYHNLDLARGLFYGLQGDGGTLRIVSDEQIETALTTGPADTRGGLRALCVQRFHAQIKSIQWEEIRFKGWRRTTLDMRDLVTPESVTPIRDRLAQAASPEEAICAVADWRNRKGNRT
jgi:proteasome accessory factor A